MRPSNVSAPGLEFLSTVRRVDFPENWYDLGASDHFWFRWRYEAATRQFRDIGLSLEEPLRALDVGCGAGILRDQIEAQTCWTVDVCDLELEALRRAAPGRGRRLYYDILDRQPALEQAYDIVVAYDVVEHLKSVDDFLAAAIWHLKPHGHLLVNVPALEGLRSRYDEAAGHLRRYSTASLAAQFIGLEHATVIDARYWGLALIPLVALRKLLLSTPRRRASRDVITIGFRVPNPLVNKSLTLLMGLELAALRRPPLGTSVLVAVRRQ
jgi:SAM-dependent methyltransferase